MHLECGSVQIYTSFFSFFPHINMCYPVLFQVDCKKGPDSDKQAFAAFVRELRTAFRPKGYLLTAAVSPSKVVIDAGMCHIQVVLRVLFHRDVTSFKTNQQEGTVRSYRNFSHCCSSCSVHTSHLSTYWCIKPCFPATCA